MICSLPGVRGTPGGGVGIIGTPARQLVDLVSGSIHETGGVSSFFYQCFPTYCRWLMGSPFQGLSYREPTISLLPPLLEHLGKRRCPCRRCHFPQVPLRPSLAPQKPLSFHQHSRGVFLSPAISLSSHFLLDSSSVLT